MFDRVTGMPVWPIEERVVPQSDIPGEQSSPAQPFPTAPPPFTAKGTSLDDVFDPETGMLYLKTVGMAHVFRIQKRAPDAPAKSARRSGCRLRKPGGAPTATLVAFALEP